MNEKRFFSAPLAAGLTVALLGLAVRGQTKEKAPLDRAALLESRDKTLSALKDDPKNLAQWKRLSMIQRHLGDEKGTEDALAKAVALSPGDAGVNFMFGLLHEKRGERELAAVSYRTCRDNALQEKMKIMCVKHLRRVEAP